MNANTQQQIMDAFALAADRQAQAIESAIDDLRALSSFEGKLLIDVEALDEAFGEKKTPQKQAHMQLSPYAIRA